MIELIRFSDKKTKSKTISSYTELMRAINDKVKPYELYIGKVNCLHGCFSRLNIIFDGIVPDDYFYGLDEWDIEHVTNISYMFSNLNYLTMNNNMLINIEGWIPKEAIYSFGVFNNSDNFLKRNILKCSDLFIEKYLDEGK